MTALPELAITGATGAVGGMVAAELAERDIPFRMVVRDLDSAPNLVGAVSVVASDFGAGEEMTEALDGADTLFLVSGREAEDRLERHRTAVDAARRAGVERIVYLSFLGAAPDSVFTLGRQHFATEQHIKASGVRYTFLRDSMYADFVPYFAGQDGVIRGPAGDGAVSWITRADVAATVVAVLTQPGHDGMTYSNTGPEALTLAETAAVLERVTERPISYHEETVEEAWESRRPTGAPEWEIEGWISSYLAIATGEISGVSDSVERTTGHPPQALEPFLRANPELWSHLAG